MMKLAPEGYPFILGFLSLTVLAAFLSLWAATVPLALTLFMAYFFRDPERHAPEGENIFVSPADGKVILISPDPFLPLLLKGAGEGFIEVSIFMSPLDVHVNRAPCDGTVAAVVYTPGAFFSAFKPEASLRNENIALLLDTEYGKILLRQVAGFLARRAVCRVSQGDSLEKGERYGIIKFSSRLDIYLPGKAQVKVKLGDKVRAGETVIAEIQSEP
ncbi:MAG: phosphatidylserine decarboxylase family protein [Nitrospirae bacterium]|nr:phosphatidylserine decarboxylase family protein [Nitrospirota bacterium]